MVCERREGERKTADREREEGREKAKPRVAVVGYEGKRGNVGGWAFRAAWNGR